MSETIKADVCIIGAGAGGLSVAAGAAQLGLKTVLIEKDRMGGDCLYTGCVPSKALLAAAKQAQAHRSAKIHGIEGHEPHINFGMVKDHVRDAIKAIEPNDSQDRFEGMGVTVLRETAEFIGRDVVRAGSQSVQARYFVIATGSRPVVPPLDGIDPARVLTNETIFDLQEKPEHLLVLGGGPIGVEMAQAHRRLGSRVSLFDLGPILPQGDPACVSVIRQALKKEGVALYEQVGVTKVGHVDKGVTLSVEKDGRTVEVSGSHLLVAAGRKPVTDGLGLDRAGVKIGEKGIAVDKRLRTTNRKIFAIGDCAGGPQFTHVAGYHAGIIIRNICFKMPAKVDYSALPWVTYCDPELAQAGMSEAAAREKYGDKIVVSEWQYAENDRAIATRSTEGLVRVISDKKGRILGASIAGAQAGELIGLWALALSARLKLDAVAGMIMPYPTLSEVSKRAAGGFFTPKLFSAKTRRLVGLLQKLPI